MIIGLSGRMHSGKDLVAKIIQYLMWTKNPTLQGFETFTKKGLEEKVHSDYKWEVKKFAYKLKQIATILTGVPIENWEDQDFKKLEMPPEWDQLKQVSENEPDEKGMSDGYLKVPMTYREFLQKLGSEAIRDGLHVNTWCNALFADYTEDTGYRYEVQPIGGLGMSGEQMVRVESDPEPFNNGYPNWIISDMRFPNEYEAVKEKGGICVRIHRLYDIQRGEQDGIPTVSFKEVGVPSVHESETALDNHTFDYVLSNSGTIEDLIEEVRKMLEYFKLL
jgi:hypothetical protein